MTANVSTPWLSGSGTYVLTTTVIGNTLGVNASSVLNATLTVGNTTWLLIANSSQVVTSPSVADSSGGNATTPMTTGNSTADGAKNGNEAGVDCGGRCRPCSTSGLVSGTNQKVRRWELRRGIRGSPSFSLYLVWTRD